jgi:hypothetical protein
LGYEPQNNVAALVVSTSYTPTLPISGYSGPFAPDFAPGLAPDFRDVVCPPISAGQGQPFKVTVFFRWRLILLVILRKSGLE